MKKKFYTARVMGTCFLWATLLGAGSVLTACSDDDDDLTQLSSPTGSEAAEATATSLTFSWNKMSNVIQYGYTLKDADGNALVTDVTTAHTVTFSGLQPRSTYTLEVTAYAAVGSEYSNSQPLVLTGSTLSYIQLEAPTVSAEAAARSVISWTAVDHADTYAYSYVKDGETISGETTETSIEVDFLPLDEAVTVSVYAESLGDDLYTVSEAGSVDVTRTRELKSSVTTDMLDGNTYENLGTHRTLSYYTDDSYVVSAWYGTEGYDLEFIVPDAETGEPVFNAYYEGGWYSLVASATESVWAYTSGYQGVLYGNMNEGGLYFWDNTANTYYYLEWPSTTLGKEVEELLAENVRFYYSSILADFYCDLYKITRGDGSVYYSLKNFMDGEDLQFTLDASYNMTFTNLNEIVYQGVSYYLWGTDWSDSYPLYLTSEPDYYIDYAYFYGAKGYNYFYIDGDSRYSGLKWGMITLSYSKYQEGSDTPTNGYEYIYISMD
jgi:hypothetical protein